MPWLRRGQFVAIGKGGRQVTIIYEVNVEDVANTGDPHEQASGGTRFRTATEDLPVERIRKGKYRLKHNKEILTTDDPGEPDLT